MDMVKGYGVLFFAKNMGTHASVEMCLKYK